MTTTDAFHVIAALWIAWVVLWVMSAWNVKATRWREPLLSQALHRVPIWVAIWLLALPRTVPGVLSRHFVPPSMFVAAVSVILVIAGLGLSLWARLRLGRNWSGTVTVKENHTLVVTGPYAMVRHPIYSGILLGLLGTALAIGEWRGLLALLCALAAFVIKSRIEEQRMRETFTDYEAYRRRTKALIPFIF